MKTNKKIWSILIVILLMFQFIPVNIFASESTTSPENMDPNSVEYRNWKDSIGGLISSTTTSSALNIGTTTTPSAFRFRAIGAVVNNQLNNDYISIATSNIGRFTIGTTGGNPDNPNDNNKNLLYGHPSPWSSYTTLRLDQNNYIFTSSQQTVSGNSKISSYTTGDINVQQVLSIVKNTATNREDTVQIKYIVKNNGAAAHDAGIRIMMDTMLGANDAAPFRIPNIGAVTTELELSGNNIPEYWQAFDSLSNPSVISQGTLVKSGERKPDKVQFTNWGRVYNMPWGYTVNPSYRNGDSAVSVIWNPTDIQPGEQREYITYYGLSEFQQDLRPPLALSLTGAASIDATDEGYSPNPFTVTAYVMNTGAGIAKNVYADLRLPEGLMIASGEDTHKALGDLAPGQEKQISYDVYVVEAPENRNLSYAVSVYADGTDPKTLARNITIPASKTINNTAFHLGSVDENNGTTSVVGDPVNVANGNFITQKNDISITGKNPLQFMRFYNSRDNYQGPLGSNWHHSFDYKLRNINDNKMRATYNDGHIEDFTLNSDGTYTSMAGKYDKLIKNSDQNYSLTTKDGTIYNFDTHGKLISIQDLNGNKQILTYDSDKLIKVENGFAYLTFEYTGKLISKVTDSTGRSVQYSYTSNNLTSITDVEGNTSKYEYDNNNRITKKIDALNVVRLENIYDDKGRVIQQNMADGSKCFFSYDDTSQTSTYIDKNGTKTSYKIDKNNRVYENDFINGSEKMIFNDNNQIIAYTDKNGNTYNYEYDNNGNVTKETDPLGNIKKFTFDGNNKVTSITNPDGSVYTYSYDSKGNILSAVDPLGRTVKIEYNDKGLPVKLTQPSGAFTTIQYDANGNPAVVTDPDGNATAYTYDSLNRVTTITKPMGNKIEFNYTASGKIKNITYPDGSTSSAIYDTRGLLTQETDQAGRTTHYKYNSIGKLSEKTDALGGVTKYEYDSMWNVSKVTKPDGSTEIYRYNAANKLETVTDGENKTKTYSYDNNGNVIKQTDANGSVSSFLYDALNRITETTNANNASTQYDYTYNGKIKKVVDALKGETDYNYDAAGQLIDSKNAAGAENQYTYNALGNVETVTDAKGGVTKYEYNNSGKVTKVTKPNATIVKLEYDKNGNLSKYIDEKGNVTVYTYDSMDRLVNIQNANGNSKKVEYTPSGKVSALIDENGNRTAYKYDALDRMIETVDAKGGKTSYVYDAVGNLTEVHQYKGVTSDTINSMKNGKDSAYSTELKEIITKYQYDKRGLLIQEIDPANKVKVYTYDANGNLLSQTDKDGQVTKYEYDAVNNLSKVNYNDGKQVSYHYNSLNQITSMTDWLGTTNYGLDALGRITKVTDYQNKVTEYSYDKMGDKQSVKYPDGSTVSYDYDLMGRLTKVTDGQNKVTTYKYDELGNVIEKLLPNGVKTVDSYDTLSRINAITDYDVKGKVIDTYKYAYDAVGNKTQVDQSRYNNDDRSKHTDEHDETEGKTQYTYDALNQLIQIMKPEQSIEKYFYDTLGNRVRKEIWDDNRFKSNTDYNYDVQNQLVEINGKDETISGKHVNKPVTMEYDERGNLIKTTSDDKIIGQYTFDATNKMTSATDWLGVVSSYTYDGAGRRVQVQIQLPKPKADKDLKSKGDKDNNNLPEDIKNQIKDKYEGLLDSPDLKKEYSYVIDQTSAYNNVLMVSGKNENQKYTYGLDVLSVDNTGINHGNPENGDKDQLSHKDNPQLNSNNKVDRSYYLQDELGSTKRLLDEKDRTQAVYNYDAFGKPIRSEGIDSGFRNPSNIFSYTGYQYDQSTGLMYANARYYMPETGRFISQDSYKGRISDPGSLNRYVYCNNNPLVHVDPAGFWEIWVQNYKDGESYQTIEYEFSKIQSTLAAAVNALPFGSAIDYNERIQDVSGFLTSCLDGPGGLVSMYKYRPDNDLIERIKKWDNIAPTVNDILDKSKIYERAVENLSSKIAKNVVKNAASVITVGFGIYDAVGRANRVDRDKYIQGMIRAAGLEDKLRSINNTADLYILMTFIESKLNSYGSNDYKLYNKYFGDSFFGINDYTIGPSWWDNLLGNGDAVRQNIEDARKQYSAIADRLAEDFNKATSCDN